MYSNCVDSSATEEFPVCSFYGKESSGNQCPRIYKEENYSTISMNQKC